VHIDTLLVLSGVCLCMSVYVWGMYWYASGALGYSHPIRCLKRVLLDDWVTPDTGRTIMCNKYLLNM